MDLNLILISIRWVCLNVVDGTGLNECVRTPPLPSLYSNTKCIYEYTYCRFKLGKWNWYIHSTSRRRWLFSNCSWQYFMYLYEIFITAFGLMSRVHTQTQTRIHISMCMNRRFVRISATRSLYGLLQNLDIRFT